MEAQRIAKEFLRQGDIAIDATAGNGFDTLFLAHEVGANGIVYAVDLQQHAIRIVIEKISRAGMLDRCRLRAISHADLNILFDPQYAGRVSVAMFNLGYLPNGDKTIVTTPKSTIAALNLVATWLKTGGLLSILVYLGHNGGVEESKLVSAWIATHQDRFEHSCLSDENNPKSPVLWNLVKRA